MMMMTTTPILGLQVYLVVVTAYLSYVIPCSIMEYYEIFSKEKLQRNPTAKEVRLCARMVALNFAWLLPATYLSTGILQFFVETESSLLVSTKDVDPATVTREITRLVFFFLVDDVWFYAYHRLLHSVPKLYQMFHKPHHVFTAPFSATAFATHPVEMALQAVGATAGPALWFLLASDGRRLTRASYFGWLVVRQWQGINDHAGWDLPGGTKAHDRHHQKFNVNYASVFHFIDRILGTDYKEEETR